MRMTSLSALTAGAALPSLPSPGASVGNQNQEALAPPMPPGEVPIVVPPATLPPDDQASHAEAAGPIGEEQSEEILAADFENDGTTAEIVSMLGHAFEGFSLPPPTASVQTSALSGSAVRLSVRFAPNLSAIGMATSATSVDMDSMLESMLEAATDDEPRHLSEAEHAVAAASEVLEVGDDEAMKSIMMALVQQLATEGAQAELAGHETQDTVFDDEELSVDAMSVEVIQDGSKAGAGLEAMLNALDASMRSGSALELDATSRTPTLADPVGVLEEARSNPLEAPPAVSLRLRATGACSVRMNIRALRAPPRASDDSDLYGLLSTLRDQLVESDYVSTHPGDPNLLPVQTDGLDGLLEALRDTDDISIGAATVGDELSGLVSSFITLN